MLRAREISSVELLEEFRRQIERHNPWVNAIVAVDYERALRQARACDDARSRLTADEQSPLLGLLMTVKESFDVAGMATTWGLPAFRSNQAVRNAEAVDRLADAGAIVFGKTNVPAGLSDCQTHNVLFGRTNNPWNRDVTCGGSSGGSAAALAARFSPVELGSDLGGSIRTPAHFCGVFSHKPSYGLVSLVGHSPFPTMGRPDLAVAGPMARNADDLELLFRILVGPARHDAPAWRVDLPAPRFDKIEAARVAVLADHEACPVDAGIVTAIQELAGDLRRAGAKVEENVAWPIDLVRCCQDYMLLVRAVGFSHAPRTELAGLAAEAGKLADNDESYRAAVRRAAALSHRDWAEIDERRQSFRAAWDAFFRDYDVVMCPVHSSAAFPHMTDLPREERTILVNGRAQDYNGYLFWLSIAGLSYLPCTVRPIGRSAGLPVGVQLIGPYLDDLTTIQFARLIEDVVGDRAF